MTVDQTNPVARFKAIGYSKIPESASSDTAAAEVSLIFKMKLSALEPLKDQLVTSLHQVMGSKPNLKVMVDTIRAHGHADEAAEAVIHVLEAGNLGATRKVPASELHAFLTSPASTQALQKLNIVKVSTLSQLVILTKHLGITLEYMFVFAGITEGLFHNQTDQGLL